MSAVDVAPGSWCPTDLSPRYDARPFLACRGMVERMPASAAAAASSTACATGSPAAILERKVSTAGSSASTIVLSPSDAVPRSFTEASAAARTSASCAPSNVVSSPSTRPALFSALPQSGPLAPPTVETRVRPATMSSRPGVDPAPASRAWTPASHPQTLLMPWSPSPMAASSWTRWSRSARTDVSISCIQEVIVAASMTFSTIKVMSDAPPQGCRVNRRVPQADQLVVQLEHGQRGAGHLKRGDVAADQVPHRFQPCLTELGVDLAIDKVELEQRGAAHAVDKHEHLRAVLRLQVGQHSLDHHVDHLGCPAQLRAPAAGLTVDANAKLDLAFGQVENGFTRSRRHARRQRHTEGSRAVVDVLDGVGHLGEVAAGFGGRTRDLFREHGRAHTPPACRVDRVLHGHVRVDDHRGHLDALVGRVFGRKLEVEHVARVVLDDVDDTGAAVNGFCGGKHLR